jgi:hypothetical protein
LKTRAEQSEDFGDKLWEWLNEPKTDSCVGGAAFAKEQLAADGIVLGGGWQRQLSEFRSWWRLRRRVNRAESKARDAEELLRKLDLGLTQEKISQAGQIVFAEEALEAENAEEYREMEYLRLAKETARTKAELEKAKLELRKVAEQRMQGGAELDREKYQRDTCKLFLKWFADEQAKSIVSGGGTNAEKIEALGRKMFGEDWDE